MSLSVWFVTELALIAFSLGNGMSHHEKGENYSAGIDYMFAFVFMVYAAVDYLKISHVI